VTIPFGVIEVLGLAGILVVGCSCNRFFGPVRIERESISFGPLASTRMACAEPIGNQESKYLEALRGAEGFALDGATLSIYSKGMQKPLRFARVMR